MTTIYTKSGRPLSEIKMESAAAYRQRMKDRIHYWELVLENAFEGGRVERFCIEQIARCKRGILAINELERKEQGHEKESEDHLGAVG